MRILILCAALLVPAQAFAIGVWRGPYLNDAQSTRTS